MQDRLDKCLGEITTHLTYTVKPLTHFFMKRQGNFRKQADGTEKKKRQKGQVKEGGRDGRKNEGHLRNSMMSKRLFRHALQI